MPRKYIRKLKTLQRGSWTEENLLKAIRRIQASEISIREAERVYGVPSRTLRRRISSVNLKKTSLGPQGIFGPENEKGLVTHIQRLEACGFAPDRKALRILAYDFAEKLRIKHPFSRAKQMAGYDWLISFLERNPELSLHKPKSLPPTKYEQTNQQQIHCFYKHLEHLFITNNLLVKPSNIFNMGEGVIRLINQQEESMMAGIMTNGSFLISSESMEHVSVVACCSAEGIFLPPVIITKGTKKEHEFIHDLPLGSSIYVNTNVLSANLNTNSFRTWLKDHFIPCKPAGITVLIVDGPASYCDIEALEIADQNDIVILCIPSQTNHLLQPLDSFFWLLKAYFEQEVQNFLQLNKRQSIFRHDTSHIIGKAWKKAESVGVAISGFKATGIFPLNPKAIPDHMFSAYHQCDESEISQFIPTISLVITPSTNSVKADLLPYFEQYSPDDTFEISDLVRSNIQLSPTELLCEISNSEISGSVKKRRKPDNCLNIMSESGENKITDKLMCK